MRNYTELGELNFSQHEQVVRKFPPCFFISLHFHLSSLCCCHNVHSVFKRPKIDACAHARTETRVKAFIFWFSLYLFSQWKCLHRVNFFSDSLYTALFFKIQIWLVGFEDTFIFSWKSNRHLWADCLENVGASTCNNTMGFHVLLQGKRYVYIRNLPTAKSII